MGFDLSENLIAALRSARKAAVLTGAGISAESGVPTFREAQTGLWAKYDPQQLATPQAFQRDPALVWDWYTWRRSLISKAKPNAGHKALVRMAELIQDFVLITQNVDGLHQQAGSRNVIELHGNIMKTKCFDCSRPIDEYQAAEGPNLSCPVCNGPSRPDVVWFGENLPYEAISSAFAEARDCDIFFSIGTSAVVHPAASLPLEAVDNGVPTVEINPQHTPFSPFANYVLLGPAGVVLPALVQATWSEKIFY